MWDRRYAIAHETQRSLMYLMQPSLGPRPTLHPGHFSQLRAMPGDVWRCPAIVEICIAYSFWLVATSPGLHQSHRGHWRAGCAT